MFPNSGQPADPKQEAFMAGRDVDHRIWQGMMPEVFNAQQQREFDFAVDRLRQTATIINSRFSGDPKIDHDEQAFIVMRALSIVAGEYLALWCQTSGETKEDMRSKGLWTSHGLVEDAAFDEFDRLSGA